MLGDKKNQFSNNPNILSGDIHFFFKATDESPTRSTVSY